MKAFGAWLIILFIIVSFPALLFAQWEYGGKPIGYKANSTDLLAVTTVGNGATVVVWNSVWGNDYDIFAQYVDSAGYTHWGDYGILVYEDESTWQRYPAVLPDGEDGVFIVWSDWRHTWDQGVALYGQRLDREGNIQWDPNGVRLTADTMSHTRAKLFDDGYGGFVAVYRNSYYQTDIGAQRASGEGNIYWDLEGITLTHAEYNQLYHRTCKASDSTFITCWKDRRDNSEYDSDIYIQSFDLSGNILWDPDGIPAVHWLYDQGYLDAGHDIVADGQGGAIVVWVDKRHYAYYDVLYADRFSASGQSLWQSNGMKLGNELYYEALECQAFKLDYNFMFLWRGGRTSAFRVSYLDVNGEFIWPEPVVLDSNHAEKPFMDPEGIFKYLIVYYDGNDSYWAGTKIDTTGFQYWPNMPRPGAYTNRLRLLTDGFGGMITLWAMSDGPFLNIARVYEDGRVGGDTTTSVYEEPIHPKYLVLYQNYPNPFNDNTIVEYSIKAKTGLSMKIFNVLGQCVLSRNLGICDPGNYAIRLNMENYPSGLYFLNITDISGIKVEIKMIMLK